MGALSTLFRALADPKTLSTAKVVHCKIIISGLLPDVVTSNNLILMYVKYGIVDDARNVFDQMTDWNVVSWSILINAYSTLGPVQEAIACLRSMVSRGTEPNDFTYVSILFASASLKAAKPSKEIHGRIYRFEHGVSNSFVGNSLVNSYSKCGLVCSARRVFDGIPQTNLVSWGALISGYHQSGEHEEALRIFSLARKRGVIVNEFLLATVVSACADLEELMAAKQVHCLALRSGHLLDSFVEAGIIDMYVNFGDLESAFLTFSDVEEPGLASWAVIIKGYALEGHGEKAMQIFRRLHSAGLRPNEHVLASILVGCAAVCMVKGGMQVHSLIVKLGYPISSYVGNTMMDFYAKCRMLRESSLVFDAMEEKDIVSWNVIIIAFIRQGDLIGASKLLKEILLLGNVINIYTWSSVLSLCADIPTIACGLETHCCVLKLGFDANVVIGVALIDMYAKCGWLKNARQIFDRMSPKSTVSWNSMIVGYAQHGYGMEALEIFERMEAEGITPNGITFIGVFSACSHVGLVELGENYFKLMKTNGITPTIDHYACMVDLFARAGQTKRAYSFIKSIPLEPNTIIWRCLLAGCKIHGDSNIGQLAANQILKDDPQDISTRALTSVFYASAGLWNERAKIRGAPKKGQENVPGRSWIEVRCRIPCPGERSHKGMKQYFVQ